MQNKDNILKTIDPLIRIGIDKGIQQINFLFHSPVSINASELILSSQQNLKSYFVDFIDEKYCAVFLDFKGSLFGIAKLIFKKGDAYKLVDIFTGDTIGKIESDALYDGAFAEIGNIIINAILGTISNSMELYFIYGVPTFQCGNIDAIVPENFFPNSGDYLLVKTTMLIENYKINCNFILLLDTASLQILFDKATYYLTK